MTSSAWMRSVVAVGATLGFLVVYKIQIVLVGPVKLHLFSFTLTEHDFDFQPLATQNLLYTINFIRTF